MPSLAKIAALLSEETPRAREALKRLVAKLGGGGPDNMLRNSAVVGEQYVDAALRNPDFFVAGRRYADSEAGLAKQFGVGEPIPTQGDYMARAIHGDVFRPTSPGGSYANSPGIAEYTKPLYSDSGALSYDHSREALEQLEGLRDIWDPRRFRSATHYDATSFGKGSGDGQRAYAAAYGALGLDPSRMNYSDVLTPVNKTRRSFNQAAAIARNPALADQLLVNYSQLQNVPMNVRRIHDLPPQEMIGALQLAGNSQMLGSIGSRLDHYEKYLGRKGLEAKPEIAADTLKLSRAVNRMADTGGWDTEALEGLGRAIRSVSARPGGVGTLDELPPMGDKTARRLGLSLRALDGQDISDLVHGLEYRKGGAVRSPRGRLKRLGV